MKIIHIVPTYLPAYRYGGPIFAVHGLCKYLVELGHDISVFTTNVDGDANLDVPLGKPVDIDGVQVLYFPVRHLRRLYYCPPMHKALVEHIAQYDLVHNHSIFLWPTWRAAHTARRHKIPYIVSPRGMLIKTLIQRKNRRLKEIWLHCIEKKNLESASAIHFTSRLEAEEATRFSFRLPQSFIIPNGVEYVPENERESKNGRIQRMRDKSKHNILFLGRINWKKGLDRLIPAMIFVPNAHLTVAGNDEEGYTSELKRLADRHSVSDRIAFRGPVYGEDKRLLFQEADLFVLPSYSENFGNTVLEAMAAGCPVVITPAVGLADAIKQANAGLVVDGDARALGDGMRGLLADSEKLERMRHAGKKLVQNEFRWEKITKDMENIYKLIIDSVKISRKTIMP